MEIKYNDYKEQLDKSLSQEDKDFWDKYFKDNIDWNVTLNEEYKGIDAFINNKKMQFKLREFYYPDILIEFAHSNGEQGWINKEQQCDCLVYGWRGHNEIYFFEWRKLIDFWKKNKKYLYKKYGKKNIHEAHNKNKITSNYSIPFEEFPKNIYKILKPYDNI
tara:strand:+ start:147 stop:632 length:486 start_codon:yes stop_codon:yes gene_type:complete